MYFVDPKLEDYTVAALKIIQETNDAAITRNIQVNLYTTNKQQQTTKGQSTVQMQG